MRHLLDPKKIALVQQVESRMQGLCRAIDSRLPEGIGFALVTFTFGDNGYATYGSNAERGCMVKALRECADVLEAKMDAQDRASGERMRAERMAPRQRQSPYYRENPDMRRRHEDAHEAEEIAPCGVSGAGMRLATFPCGALHGTFHRSDDILIARCAQRPWKLIVWEPLRTKAPGPHLVQAYCCYVNHVIFYARPYYSAPHAVPLLFEANGRWHANEPRKPGGLVYFDRVDSRIHLDAMFAFEGETWRVGGGRVVWGRRADGRGKQWWFRYEARRPKGAR